MLALAGVPSLIQLVGFLAMPESPRWLASKGAYQEAIEVLRRFRGPTANLEAEFDAMRASHLDVEGEEGQRESRQTSFCMPARVVTVVRGNPIIRSAQTGKTRLSCWDVASCTTNCGAQNGLGSRNVLGADT